MRESEHVIYPRPIFSSIHILDKRPKTSKMEKRDSTLRQLVQPSMSIQ